MSVGELRERFYLGFFNKVIDASGSFDKGNEEVEFLVLRSRLGQNQVDFVLNTTKSQTTPVQKGVHLLCQSIKSSNKEEVISLLETVDHSLVQNSKYYAICVGIINMHIERYPEVLEVLNSVEDSEAASLRVQALLNINRVDLAETELPQVTDPILRSLCSAYVALYKGEEETKNALFSLLDLSERFEPSPILMNLIAVCHFSIGEWENGQNAILSASEQFPNDEATAINLAVSLSHTSPGQRLSTQLSLIKNFKNAYNSSIEEMLKTFDETASRLETDE